MESSPVASQDIPLGNTLEMKTRTLSPSSSKTQTMAAPPLPSRTKPSMTISIPGRSWSTTTQIYTPPSTPSPTLTPTWSTSRNSPCQTPLTSGQTTPSSDFFTINPHSTSRTKPIHQCQIPQVDKNGQPLHALERTYYKPTQEIDVGEALDDRPLPGTFRYVLEKELRGERKYVKREQTNEQKKEEFERVKKALRGL